MTGAAELQRVLEDAAFVTTYGFRVEAAGDGECTVAVPFRPSHERPGGIVSGPVFMAAADVAMWLAILSRLGPADRSVTSGMTTAFLSAARREDFLCTARIVRLGHRAIYGVAECVANDSRLLSHHTVTYTRPTA